LARRADLSADHLAQGDERASRACARPPRHAGKRARRPAAQARGERLVTVAPARGRAGGGGDGRDGGRGRPRRRARRPGGRGGAGGEDWGPPQPGAWGVGSPPHAGKGAAGGGPPRNRWWRTYAASATVTFPSSSASAASMQAGERRPVAAWRMATASPRLRPG